MRVGIIGCGGVAERHIIPLRRLTGVEIVGVADLDEYKGREIARCHGIRNVYRDAESLLREQRPDVVHILTPPQSYKDLSIQAMEAGCHVFVEKPLALNVEEADEMIAASQHHGVTLGVCHNLLFEPAVLKAKELVERGQLGKVVGVQTFYRAFSGIISRKKEWLYKLPGGPIHEPIPHFVYLHMEFLGNVQVLAAQAKTTGSDNLTPSEDVWAMMEGETGLGSMAISTSTKPFRNFLTIHGTEMSVHLDLLNNTLIKYRSDGKTKLQKVQLNIDQVFQLLATTFSNSVGALLGWRSPMTLGHGTLIQRFYEALRRGSTPPVTCQDGRAVVAALDQIWLKLGRTKPPPDGE
jgi:predicted dehydrogenase